mgnify:CR=1 FL=1
MKFLKLITQVSHQGIISTEVYDGWFKPERMTQEDEQSLAKEQRGDLHYFISVHENKIARHIEDNPLIDTQRSKYIIV